MKVYEAINILSQFDGDEIIPDSLSIELQHLSTVEYTAEKTEE